MQIVSQPEEQWRTKVKLKKEKLSQFFLLVFYIVVCFSIFLYRFIYYCHWGLKHHQDGDEKRNDDKT